MQSLYHATETIDGEQAILLGYRAAHPDERDLLVKVSPALGNNLYAYRIGAHDVVYHDPRCALTTYRSGNPILYPLPNRVENCRYTVGGERYWQKKHAVPIFLHSLVFDEPWDFDPPVQTETDVRLRTYLQVDKQHPVYEGFPFVHELQLEYRLTRTFLQMTYTVKNLDSKPLPYGFGVHTYFTKLSGETATQLQVPAAYTMQVTDALLPTGELLPTKGQPSDLHRPVPVGDLDLDTCFTGRTGERVCIDHTTIGLQLWMETSDDFTHVQVYTPPGAPYFCVEMQTCSADAHNLHAKGFRAQAHLLTVAPQEHASGFVRFGYRV